MRSAYSSYIHISIFGSSSTPRNSKLLFFLFFLFDGAREHTHTLLCPTENWFSQMKVKIYNHIHCIRSNNNALFARFTVSSFFSFFGGNYCNCSYIYRVCVCVMLMGIFQGEKELFGVLNDLISRDWKCMPLFYMRIRLLYFSTLAKFIVTSWCDCKQYCITYRIVFKRTFLYLHISRYIRLAWVKEWKDN